MGARKKRRRRSSPELHFGINYGRGHIPHVGAAAPHSWRVYAIIALSLIAMLILGILATWDSESGLDFREALRVAAAASRGVAFLIGVLVLPLVLVYYYSAGIDWPLEEASRIAMIGALIGLVLYGLLMPVGVREGWLDLRSLRAWVVPGLLALIAVAACVGQRSG